jgi:hypothetical protein
VRLLTERTDERLAHVERYKTENLDLFLALDSVMATHEAKIVKVGRHTQMGVDCTGY